MPNGTQPRRRRRLLALLAALIGTIVAVLLVEVTLRCFDPIGMHYHEDFRRYIAQAAQFDWEGKPPDQVDFDGRLFRHRANLDLDLGPFRLRTNRLGLRGPELATPKTDGVFRVLVLGDSVVFGWGVDDEHTFTRRLEREWNATAPRVRLEVVNAGHALYDTVQEAAALREFLPVLTPDLVLLVYVVNDVEPSRDLAENLLFGKQPDPAEVVDLPHDVWSRTADWLFPVLPGISQLLGTQTDLKRRVAKMLPPGAVYAPEKFGKGPRGWPRSQRALLAMRDACAAAAVPFLLFDHSLPAIVALEPFCREQGIAYEPLRFSPEDHALGITNSMVDSHANAKGNGLLLERLRAALLRRQLLPK